MKLTLKTEVSLPGRRIHLRSCDAPLDALCSWQPPTPQALVCLGVMLSLRCLGPSPAQVCPCRPQFRVISSCCDFLLVQQDAVEYVAAKE